MSWIECDVDELNEIDPTVHKELEGIVFRDDAGKERRFKVKAMISQSVTYMKSIIPDVDWDETNPHIAVVLGNEIKE